MLFSFVKTFIGCEKQYNAPPVNILVPLARRFLACLREDTFLAFFIGTKPGTDMIHDYLFIINRWPCSGLVKFRWQRAPVHTHLLMIHPAIPLIPALQASFLN